MKNYLLILAILFGFELQAKTTQAQSDIFKACSVAFSKSSTSDPMEKPENANWNKSKVIEFCGCYTNNMSLLISPKQVAPIIKWLNNKMSEEEQEIHEPLIDMEYEVISSCDKDAKWMADKAKEILKKQKKN